MPAPPRPLVSMLAKLRIVTSSAPAKMPFARSPVVVRLPKLISFSPAVFVVSASSSVPDVTMFLKLIFAIVPPARRHQRYHRTSTDLIVHAGFVKYARAPCRHRYHRTSFDSSSRYLIDDRTEYWGAGLRATPQGTLPIQFLWSADHARKARRVVLGW